jgi:hypothetical protein
VHCSRRPPTRCLVTLAEYVATIGDPKFVIDMIVGDTQRVIEYPTAGYAEEQEVPPAVHYAYKRLVDEGFTTRLIAR